MSEPRTAAGKALPEAFDRWMTTAGLPDFRDTLIAAILAIEAEASQPVLREALDAVAEVRGMSIKGRGVFAQGYAQARADIIARFEALAHPTNPEDKE